MWVWMFSLVLLALYCGKAHEINKTRVLKASVLQAISLFQLLFQIAVDRRGRAGKQFA